MKKLAKLDINVIQQNLCFHSVSDWPVPRPVLFKVHEMERGKKSLFLPIDSSPDQAIFQVSYKLGPNSRVFIVMLLKML